MFSLLLFYLLFYRRIVGGGWPLRREFRSLPVLEEDQYEESSASESDDEDEDEEQSKMPAEDEDLEFGAEEGCIQELPSPNMSLGARAAFHSYVFSAPTVPLIRWFKCPILM